jgi:hypothetical protein
MTSEEASPTPPSGIASAAERLRSLRAEARLVANDIETHVREHEAKVEAHRREVAAGKKMLMEFMPGIDKKSAEAAAFVLTSPTWTQGLIRFVGRNWRFLAFALAAGVFYKTLF